MENFKHLYIGFFKEIIINLLTRKNGKDSSTCIMDFYSNYSFKHLYIGFFKQLLFYKTEKWKTFKHLYNGFYSNY